MRPLEAFLQILDVVQVFIETCGSQKGPWASRGSISREFVEMPIPGP